MHFSQRLARHVRELPTPRIYGPRGQVLWVPAMAGGADSARLTERAYSIDAFGSPIRGDWSNVIQNAFDAANSDGFGAIYIPPRSSAYAAAQPLTFYSNLHIRGGGPGGTVLNLANLVSSGFASLTGGGSAGGVHDFVIADLTLDGANLSASGTPLVQIYGYSYWLGPHLEIRHGADIGLYSEWGTSLSEPLPNSMLAHINGVVIHDSNGAYEVDWHGPHDGLFTDVEIFRDTSATGGGNSTNGLRVADVAGHAGVGSPIKLTNFHLWGGGTQWTTALTIDSSNGTCQVANGVIEGAATLVALGVTATSTNDNCLSNLDFQNVATDCIRIGTAAGGASGFNVITGCRFNPANANCVNLANSAGGNMIAGVAYLGVSGTTMTGSASVTDDYMLQGNGRTGQDHYHTRSAWTAA